MYIPTYVKDNRGILYILSTSAIIVCNASIAKTFANRISGGQYISMTSYVIIFLTSTTSFYSQPGIPLFRLRRRYMVYLYNTLRSVPLIMKTYCVRNMPIGDATALYGTFPLFTGIFGKIILNEPYGLVNIFATFLGKLKSDLAGPKHFTHISKIMTCKTRVILVLHVLTHAGPEEHLLCPLHSGPSCTNPRRTRGTFVVSTAFWSFMY